MTDGASERVRPGPRVGEALYGGLLFAGGVAALALALPGSAAPAACWSSCCSDTDTAAETAKKLTSTIDKAAAKHAIHSNNAAHKKSRVARLLSKV